MASGMSFMLFLAPCQHVVNCHYTMFTFIWGINDYLLIDWVDGLGGYSVCETLCMDKVFRFSWVGSPKQTRLPFKRRPDHPGMCVFSYVRISRFAHVTLTLTRWPWHMKLTYIPKAYLQNNKWSFYRSMLSDARARTGQRYRERQTDSTRTNETESNTIAAFVRMVTEDLLTLAIERCMERRTSASCTICFGSQRGQTGSGDSFDSYLQWKVNSYSRHIPEFQAFCPHLLILVSVSHPTVKYSARQSACQSSLYVLYHKVNT